MYDDEACIVEVTVSINENQERNRHSPHHEDQHHPDYWGWIENDDLVMIQPTWDSFNVQFPYGVIADEEREKGKAYRLVVEEASVVSEGTGRNSCSS
jgi:hypothetical protein